MADANAPPHLGVAERPIPDAVLITGAAGFIGVNFVHWLLREQAGVRVISFDAMTYAAQPDSLPMVTAAAPERHFFIRGDVRDGAALAAVLAGEAVDAAGRRVPAPSAVFHLAAESHVDRSITGPAAFVSTNVIGTQMLLEALRARRDAVGTAPRLIHVSTDEVYGALRPEEPPVDEGRPLDPSSPYSASKAASDLLVSGWARTYGIDAAITRCSNNFGPFQYPEKLIPLMITRALADQPLPVYGDGQQVRDWLHAEDHAAALWAVWRHGASDARVYHVGANAEQANLTVVREVLAALGKPESLIAHVRDRPAHDRRYALDATRLRTETGWAPRYDFATALEATVRWYREQDGWWRPLLAQGWQGAELLVRDAAGA